ncbi:DUF1963 domain-containing protein [Actinoallomurus acaciae]|uniref:DUF1963 domain-containing protein n=1 Tax=Actinoallomurus acaciae TaxID=502577 RepID=A0ABV5YP65_9ACTN
MAEIQALCVEHLGEVLGARLAALARPEFSLAPARDDVSPTGRCHVGGPALLEPGTPWPQTRGGFPLSLVAVLDTDELAPWLGDHLPTRLGLVNVFWLQPDFKCREDDRFAELMEPYEGWWGQRDQPGDCQIVLASPPRAIEVAAPRPAQVLDRRPLNAAPIVTLPSLVGESNDPIVKTFDFRALPDFDDDRMLGPDVRFGRVWSGFCSEKLGYRPGDAQAFGWPLIDQWPGKREEGYAHLLTLPGHLLDGDDHDGGFERVMVSPDDLRTGSFTSVTYEQDGLH